MATLVLFFDGIGVGEADPARNPFAAIGARRMAPLAGGRPDPDCRFRPLDASLGVPGLPQSATGQTTILTGVNAARHAGRHLFGLPGPTLWPLLERDSIFLKMGRAGKRATFANAYTRRHLEAQRPRWSSTTRAVMAGGARLRLWDEEGARGEALWHDYTGEWLQHRGYDVPSLTPLQAAGVLLRLMEQHDLVLYEYFRTDLAGHRGTWDDRLEQARRVETLVDAVLRTVDLSQHEVLVTSDHGNLEDASHRRHTLNPVPLLVWGSHRDALFGLIHSLEDITPSLVSLS